MFNSYLSKVCCFLASKVGTSTSCALLLFSCLFPHSVVAEEVGATADNLGASQQLEQAMTQLLSRELQQWQKQLGIEQFSADINVRVPSGAKRLAVCQSRLSLSRGAIPLGNVQRKVACDSQGWSLYVRASVSVSAKIPVANRLLKRGEHISPADIDWQVTKLDASDRNIVPRLDDILGRKVARKIRRHQAIKSQQLDEPQWINIGDRVIIEARSNGFYANMSGEALEGGGKGDAIRIRNLSSGKVIVAYPIAKGRVATQF